MSGAKDQCEPVSDLVEQIVAFIQGRDYPAVCTDNVKKNKAETLGVREGEVFVTTWEKRDLSHIFLRRSLASCVIWCTSTY